MLGTSQHPLVICCPLPPPPNLRLRYRLSQGHPPGSSSPTTAPPTATPPLFSSADLSEAEPLMDITRVGRGFEVDRISNLPCNVIDNILKFLPVVDAVRTSILSRAWQYKWLIEVDLRLPSTFKGFGTLVTLDLFLVDFVAEELNKFISKCPMLEDLWIFSTHKCGDLEIDAPNLKSLRLTGNYNSVSFKTASPLLVEISLDGDFGMPRDPETFQDFETNEPLPYLSNMVKILGQLSSITKLEFSGSVLQYLASGGVPQKLPNDLNHVRHLCFPEIHFNCIPEVSCAVCLIRSSPNLLTLEIEINGLYGWEPEMEFVKLLLSAGTAVRMLEITQMHAEPTEAAFKMFEELVTFPPASPDADFIFSIHPNAT
ncbi:UNVERIFIED_CONTAM: F-box/FBD/LRR-repeat protein [Sesamum angustifolium]|uniref:F-box/FBD/LRR-repeat protein n=1 Tax=Sesamum angustifolium TaxID=2727405 RepID=A0AAW2LVZ0_9LAMI